MKKMKNLVIHSFRFIHESLLHRSRSFHMHKASMTMILILLFMENCHGIGKQFSFNYELISQFHVLKEINIHKHRQSPASRR